MVRGFLRFKLRNSDAMANNPHGPDKGKNCVVRGGRWRHMVACARYASRLSLPEELTATYVGFRVVRGR